MRPTQFDLSCMCADFIWNLWNEDAVSFQEGASRRGMNVLSAASGTPSSSETSLPAKSVLIVDADAGSADCLATELRLKQPALITACAHRAHSALLLAEEMQPDVIIIDFGSRAMSADVIAGAIFVACPASKPLMIALSGPESKKRSIQSTQLFDHVMKKPFRLLELVSLIGRIKGRS